MSNTPALLKRSPWLWVPSLYYIEGLPYLLVVVITSTLYFKLGIPNAEMALYTSSLYLAWVLKPLWSPIVEIISTNRRWTVLTQLAMAATLVGVALFIPGDNFFFLTLACFWVTAFCSATHDIAADGFYLKALPEKEQSFFVGIRSTFYRFALFTEGLLLGLAGWLETEMRVSMAWSLTIGAAALLMALGAMYHSFSLPRVEVAKPAPKSVGEVFEGFGEIFISFFRRKRMGAILAFLLLYRLGEAQLAKMASPFLLAEAEAGGLGLTVAEVGLVKGIIGILGLILGGILGGIAISRNGLKYWLWWMILAINVPNLLYVLLALFQPESLWVIAASIGVEQFGYGFGFTAYVMYLIYLADGPHQTAHYALGTGFMALSMMLPGMISGYLQESLGYLEFFIWVVIATLPAFATAFFIPLDKEFGKSAKM
jgi:PAT family beta-lactamase induction signal transducer AmpG